MCQQHLLEITYHTRNLFRINQRQFEVFIKAATISAWPWDRICVSKKQLFWFYFFFFCCLILSWKTFIKELMKVKAAARHKFCLTDLAFSLGFFLGCLRKKSTQTMQELPALGLSDLRKSLIVLVSSSDLISSDTWEKGQDPGHTEMLLFLLPC